MKKQESINVGPAMMSPETPTFELTGDFDAAKAQKSMKRKAKILTGLMTLEGLSMVATGCPQPTDNKTPPPPSCKCPNGTLHLAGETCCNILYGCVCEGDVVGQRLTGYGNIPVTNPNGVSNFNTTIINNVNEAFSWLTPDQINLISNGVREIRIVPGASNVAARYLLTNGKCVIEITDGRAGMSSEIYGILYNFTIGNYTLEVAAAAVQNSARDTIRLPKEKVDAKMMGQEVAFQAVGNAHDKLLRVMKQEGATLERA